VKEYKKSSPELWKHLLLCRLQDMVDYQRTLAREIEARLEAKCDALADLFAMDERGQLLKLVEE
jgi:hypothetical protein